MATIIKMPSSGQNAAESLIACWHVQEGDQVQRGDVLFEIETDKAVMNVESYASGCVLKILYEEGDMVAAGADVLYIGEAGEQLPEAGASAPAEETPAAQPEEVSAAPARAAAEYKPAPVLASPKARAAAKETGTDLKQLYEKLQRPVRYADVKNSQNDDFTVEKLTSMRKTIARRMLESTSTVPQFTVSVDVDASALMQLRNQINTWWAGAQRVSYNDLIAKAVCVAVREVPYVNASYTQEEIRLFKDVNVGIAVALPAGLVVPVVRKVQDLSLEALAQQSAVLIQSAKNGKLIQAEMSGGTVTISNLGMYGIDHFTAIVNKPEAAILAVGGIIEKPVCIDGQIVARPMMNITASFDHRIVDGGVGAQFMGALKKTLESPVSLLL